MAPPPSYRYLWDSMGLTYGIYGHLCFCGLEPMGFIGFYVIGVWDLWDSHRAMGLRCGTYGILMGLCDCGVGPMGLPWIHGIAVKDLWDAWGSVGLQCGT